MPRRLSRRWAKEHNVNIWGKPLSVVPTKIRTTQPKPKPMSITKLQPIVKNKEKISKPEPHKHPKSEHKSFNYIVMLEEDFNLKTPNRRKVKVGKSSSFEGAKKRYQEHKKGYMKSYILRIWGHKKCFESDMKIIFGMFGVKIGNTSRDEYFVIDNDYLNELVKHFDNIFDEKMEIPVENQKGWWK